MWWAMKWAIHHKYTLAQQTHLAHITIEHVQNALA